MDFSGKLYVAIKAWFDNIYDLYVNQTPKNVILQNAKVDENGNVSNVTIPNTAMQWKKINDWRASIGDFDRIHKFEFDLSDLTKFDANTMYPVYFRFGIGAAEQRSIGEVNIGRNYNWNGRNPSPFSDNSSSTHIAGLNFRVVGGDLPSSGAGLHGVQVKLYKSRYMHTMQLFSFHGLRIYIQSKGDTEFTSDNSVKPTETTPVYSGFYIRGGLLYRGFTKGMSVEPTLVTEATRIYDNASYNRSEWLAPFPYKQENNTAEIEEL